MENVKKLEDKIDLRSEDITVEVEKQWKKINIKIFNWLGEITKANCITHSGKFHVDDVISTIFLSKLKESIVLIRVPTIEKKWNLEDKLIYDIGLREIWSPSEK